MATADRRYVIIGNGAAGTTCAETLRKNDPSCSITLLTNEPHPLYNKVALPRYFKGVVREEKVYMRTHEQHAEKGITLLNCVTATQVDCAGHTVLLNNGAELPYDALLIATGGVPTKLRAPGAESRGVMYFQTMEDTRDLIDAAVPGKRAVVIGGSFISYELTEGFATRGVDTTWLMRGSHFLRRVLTPEGGDLVDELAREHHVTLVHNEETEEIAAADGRATGVRTQSGKEILADIVGVGVGLDLNTSFLDGTGIEVRRGIVTDRHLRTSVPDIYAAGDAAEFYDEMIDTYNIMGTWDNAISHGRTAAVNMAGGSDVYREVPTYTSTLFSSNIAVMGATNESRRDLESVTRVDVEQKEYKQLFFLGNRLVGAVTIGRPRGRKKLLAMMFDHTPVEGPREALLDVG